MCWCVLCILLWLLLWRWKTKNLFVYCFCSCCFYLAMAALLLLLLCVFVFVCFVLTVGGYCFCSWLEYWTDKCSTETKKLTKNFFLFLLRRLVLQWTCSTRTVMVRHWVINRWCLFCDRCCFVVYSHILLFLFRLFFFLFRKVMFDCLVLGNSFCLTWFLFWTSKFTYPYVCFVWWFVFDFRLLYIIWISSFPLVYALSFCSRDDDFSFVYICFLHELHLWMCFFWLISIIKDT